MPKVARLGDTSDHGGVIISAASSNSLCEGKQIARVGDMHSCPLPLHGVTPITTGSPNFICEGQHVARIGSTCGCGAVINSGASQTECA